MPNNIDQENRDQVRAIDLAAQRLIDAGLVAFPTETVYGLGADAENPAAIAKIYAAKQRPTGHPLIVHLASDADLSYWMGKVSPHAQALADAFWPGPLTLIVPRAAYIPSAVSGGQPTVGLRCPSHPVAQSLLTRFAALKPGGQGGLAAPSANKFGHVSPTRAEHVRNEFPEMDAADLLILDGGPSVVGIESTIVDISSLGGGGDVPVILRPGHILPEQIAEVLGVMPGRSHAGSPQVSGTLKAHYAPRTPLKLVKSADLPGELDALVEKPGTRVAALVFRIPAGYKSMAGVVDYYPCEHDAQAYAREIYGHLRNLDQKGYSVLLIEQPPNTPVWRAVNDRLSRAAAAFQS